MPRSYARIFLSVAAERIKFLQDITEDGCVAEGMPRVHNNNPDLMTQYRRLWDNLNINRGYGWETNPRVRVISFVNAFQGKDTPNYDIAGKGD
jgi:hypothetical protein